MQADTRRSVEATVDGQDPCPSRPQVVLKPVDALSETDLAAWEALRRCHRAYSSPLLGPGFSRLVATVRPDAHVLLVRQENALAAALALHIRPFGHARPLGAPFADYSGPIVDPDARIDLPQALHMAGLASYRAPGVIAGPEIIATGHAMPADDAFIIDRDDKTADEYVETQRAIHPKRFKNFRRLRSKIAREQGTLSLEWGHPDPERLKSLFSWKSAQFRSDGLVDVIGASHSRDILDAVAAKRADEADGLGGFLVALHLDGELIAGHFGVREGRHFHPWISAYDPALSDYGPGILLIYAAVEALGDMDLDCYHLASGHDHYKRYFANTCLPVHGLTAYAPGLKGRLQAAGAGTWQLLGARRENSMAARLQRRLDHIAACEPGLPARMQELAWAVARRGVRN